ncbi:hypothetical protein TNCV_458711 [Trichonephila clavipes]|nr:hypothetical protein TNCV_458711 [Trichonephila clavipes]
MAWFNCLACLDTVHGWPITKFVTLIDDVLSDESPLPAQLFATVHFGMMAATGHNSSLESPPLGKIMVETCKTCKTHSMKLAVYGSVLSASKGL